MRTFWRSLSKTTKTIIAVSCSFVATSAVIGIILAIIFTLPAHEYSQQDFCGHNVCRGVWAYGIRKVSAESLPAMARWTSERWNYVLLSAQPNAHFASAVREFTKAGLAVHIMFLEDTNYITSALTNDFTDVDTELDRLLAWISAEQLDVRGLHTDTEPHALPEWSAATGERRRAIIDAWLRVHHRVSSRTPLPLTAAVPWWLPAQDWAGGVAQEMMEAGVKAVMPMIYTENCGSTAEKLWNRAKHYISAGIPTLVGMGYMDYKTEDEFFDVERAQLHEVIKSQVEVNTTAFWGTSAFQNACFSGFAESGGVPSACNG